MVGDEMRSWRLPKNGEFEVNIDALVHSTRWMGIRVCNMRFYWQNLDRYCAC